nr:reverse transcriptase domain-containing protein [Tanacetum cinerariifolium]
MRLFLRPVLLLLRLVVNRRLNDWDLPNILKFPWEKTHKNLGQKDGSTMVFFRPESPFKFTAFQGGPSICLGKEFAYRQMKILAAFLVYFFKFKRVVSSKEATYQTMFTLHMDGGLHLARPDTPSDTPSDMLPKHLGSTKLTGSHLSAACQVSGQRLATSSPGASDFQCLKGLTTCPKVGHTLDLVTPMNQITREDDNLKNSPSLQDQILEHISSLKGLIKQHNKNFGTLIEPIRLTFGDEEDNNKVKTRHKRDKDEKDEDLQNPYKEVLKSLFTRNGQSRRVADVGMVQNVSADFEWSEKREGDKASYRGNMPPRAAYGGRQHQMDNYNNFNRRDHYHPYVSPRVSNMRYENQRHEVNHLSLDALSTRPKEILATKLQLQLSPCPPMVETPKKENLDRYCDYHGEKGHYTNDCYQLKRQLEAALESEKLSHLVRDVRQQGVQGGIISIQHHSGMYRNERAQGCVVYHSRYDEVPYPKRNCHSGHLNGFCVRMPTIGKETSRAGRKGRRGRPGQTEKACRRGNTCQSSFPEWHKKESFGHREEPSSDEIGGRMGQGWYCEACKDYYPLLKIDLKIEANAGATYQRLVDSAVRTQLDMNLEAYVDDMVIKNKMEREMIMDMAETFVNLYRVNMKINPRKCSFGVEEGKFLGYMEMQSLSGKLAALNRFLSRSAKRAFPFFKTLKNITKENKDDYRWTKETERAFQEMKKLILELLTLTTRALEEVLYVYLVTSQDAISGVLLAEREGRQIPISYVSRTLHDAELKLGLDYEVKKGKKLYKKELIVALKRELYFVKFIINPEEDDFVPEVILGRSFLRARVHLTQEETAKEALAIRISQRYALLEEERHVIETMAYNDKYRKILNEIWKDKVELDGKTVKEDKEAVRRIKGEALKEKDDPDINTMPYRIFNTLGREDMKKIDRGITMINYTQAEAMGKLSNVLCQVGVTTIVAKFLILDIPIDHDALIVVGRGFLHTMSSILNTSERIFSTFDGICHQTFQAARFDVLRTDESDSDNEEEYVIKRNKFGAPIYGPKPASYLVCTNLNDQLSAIRQ